MRMPNKEEVERIRKTFPNGTRVRLVRMRDPQAPPIGTLGTVVGVDDLGTVHVNWDNGSGLGVAFAEDECRRVDDD